jgi:hypothetical protein
MMLADEEPHGTQCGQLIQKHRGRPLGISIELNEFADEEIKKKIENEILWGIGVHPTEENWKVWIHALQDCCCVVVNGPTQTRHRFFFEDVQEIPRAIRNWLESYPFR